MGYHVGIQVAPGTGVDLRDRRTGGGYPPGVIVGLLVSLDDGAAEFPRQVFEGPFQDGRLAGTGGAYQVQGKYPFLPEKCAVHRGKAVVLGQDIGLDLDLLRPCPVTMTVLPVFMAMVMMAVVMIMTVMIFGAAAARNAHG
jgi:hypothetical protein